MIDLNVNVAAAAPAGWQVTPIPWQQITSELLALYVPPLRSIATHGQMEHNLELAAAAGVQTTADLTVAAIARVVAARPAGESPYTTVATLAACQPPRTWPSSRDTSWSHRFRSGPSAVGSGSASPPPPLSRAELAAPLALLKAECDDGRRGWPQWKSRRMYAMAATAAYAGLRAPSCSTSTWPTSIWRTASSTSTRASPHAQDRPLRRAGAGVRRVGGDPRGLAGGPPRSASVAPGCRSPLALAGMPGPVARYSGGGKGVKPLDVLREAGKRAGVAGVNWQVSGGHSRRRRGGRRQRRDDRPDTSPLGGNSREFYRQADHDTIRAAVAGLVF